MIAKPSLGLLQAPDDQRLFEILITGALLHRIGGQPLLPGPETFGRRQRPVQRQPLRPLRTEYRSDIDDAAARWHARQQRLSQMAQAQVIDLGHRLHRRRTGHAGNVAQGIDLLRQARHQRIDAGGIAQVGMEKAIKRQLRFMAIDADHRGALEARQSRDFRTYARRHAGHDQGFTVQVHGQALLLLYRHARAGAQKG